RCFVRRGLAGDHRGVRGGRSRARGGLRGGRVSVALFLGLAIHAYRYAGRPLAATLPCGVRTFLDVCTPRLPDPPHLGIVTCDNKGLCQIHDSIPTWLYPSLRSQASSWPLGTTPCSTAPTSRSSKANASASSVATAPANRRCSRFSTVGSSPTTAKSCA